MKTGDLVAVYGSLRNGLGNHGLLVGAERHDDGVIPDGTFHMRSLGGFPGLLKDGETSSPIVVEVYTVDTPERQARLDMLEGYPSFYDREQVTLVDGRVCWVYFLEDTGYYASRPLVPEGDWKKFHAPHM